MDADVIDRVAGEAKKKPRPLFRLHKVASGKTYCLVSTDQLGGGATCTINDGTGELLIQSDWGTWAYQWSTDPKHLGAPSLSAFLRAHDRTDYVYDKLHYGRERLEFDQNATIECLQHRIVGDRKEWELSEDEEDLLEELDDLKEPCSRDAFIERCSPELARLLGDQFEHLVMVEPQGSKLLREVILPSLWEALRQPQVVPDPDDAATVAGVLKSAEDLIRAGGEWVEGDYLLSAVTRILALAKEWTAGVAVLNEALAWQKGDTLSKSIARLLEEDAASVNQMAKSLVRVRRLEEALRKYGPRICGPTCQPENAEHRERCSMTANNAAVERILAG